MMTSPREVLGEALKREYEKEFIFKGKVDEFYPEADALIEALRVAGYKIVRLPLSPTPTTRMGQDRREEG